LIPINISNFTFGLSINGLMLVWSLGSETYLGTTPRPRNWRHQKIFLVILFWTFHI